MNDLKINIVYEFKKGPWGGGNQFLKALRKELKKKDVYVENPIKADCLLFNSHHNFEKILKLKISNPKKIFIHRIDGPLYLIRGNDLKIDRKIYSLNNCVADGTIYQSNWSKKKNLSSGLKKNHFETVILNACDELKFYPSEKKEATKSKFKLVAVSWSKNPNKGFDLYEFLDNNLDFNKFSMKFIGNSPISFKNIKHIKPVEPKELANHLRDADIYITGSKNDPCSNSLIEALSCGLPCVVLNDGGHPEIIKNGGLTFNNFNDCLTKIQLITENYTSYKNNIQVPKIEEVAKQYIDFIKIIKSSYISRRYKGKNLRLFDYYRILLRNNLKPSQLLKFFSRNLF